MDKKNIVSESTGQPIPNLSELEDKELRSKAASILGKIGGSEAGKERARRLWAERKQEIAETAARGALAS